MWWLLKTRSVQVGTTPNGRFGRQSRMKFPYNHVAVLFGYRLQQVDGSRRVSFCSHLHSSGEDMPSNTVLVLYAGDLPRVRGCPRVRCMAIPLFVVEDRCRCVEAGFTRVLSLVHGQISNIIRSARRLHDIHEKLVSTNTAKQGWCLTGGGWRRFFPDFRQQLPRTSWMTAVSH